MSRRVILLAAFLVAALWSASPAWAEQLAVQSTDTSAWPEVGITISLPAAAVDGPVPTGARVWENGTPIEQVSLRSLTERAQPIDVVLAVDVSGSMKGQPLADAKAAASRFVDSMGASDRVAVIAFGPTAQVRSRFTSERSALGSAVDGLAASGETALYDGVATGLDLLTAEPGRRRAIIVLTDGKDTMSSATLDSDIAGARKLGVPVYVVGLKSSDYDPKTIASLASATGGRLVSATDSQSLVAIYGQLARELQRAYRVTYTSLSPNTPDLEIRMIVDGAAVPLTKTFVLPNQAFNATVDTTQMMRPFTMLQNLLLGTQAVAVVAFSGLAAGLLGFVVLAALMRPTRPIDELALYDMVHAVPMASAAEGAGADPSSMRVVGLVEQVASKRGFSALAREKLERAGLPLRVNEYITLHVVGVLVLGLLAQLITRNLLVVVLTVALATMLPIVFLDWMESRRRRAFEDQLPDILQLIGGSLRAGYGLQQSIDLVVQQAGDPALTEFRRVQAETRLGLPLDQALDRLAERLGSQDFRWVASAIAIQREVGGNLSEVLDTLAATLRERAELRRQVHALTAEGRLSAVILAILPFFLGFGLYFVNPGYVGLLFGSGIGVLILGLGVVGLVVGIVWLQRVVTIDV